MAKIVYFEDCKGISHPLGLVESDKEAWAIISTFLIKHYYKASYVTTRVNVSATKYTLTYNCSTNGGNGNTTATVAYNSAVDLSKTCAKDGWTFVGWNTSPDGMGTNLNDYGKIDGPVTFYAIYYQTQYLQYNKQVNSLYNYF